MNLVRNLFNPREFTGRHMLAVTFLFFGTIIAVNITLAFYAEKTWTGLVVENSYVASQEFNETTAERQRQAALGWRAEAEADGRVFALHLSDRDGAGLTGLEVTADVGRTTHEDEDQHLSLTLSPDGTWQAPALLGPGLWKVSIVATNGSGEIWTREMRFVVKD